MCKETSISIVKFSRVYDGHSYSGPSCKLADLVPGAKYNTVLDAMEACNKLDDVNCVGWEAWDDFTSEMIYSTIEQ